MEYLIIGKNIQVPATFQVFFTINLHFGTGFLSMNLQTMARNKQTQVIVSYQSVVNADSIKTLQKISVIQLLHNICKLSYMGYHVARQHIPKR